MASSSKGAHAGHHHVTPIPQLAATFLLLMILLVITYLAAYWVISDVNLGPVTISGNFLNNFVALAIATTKAWFVIRIFMGVKWGSSLVKLWCLIGFVWVTIMWTILFDYGFRQYEPARSWGPPETALPAKPLTIEEGGRQPSDPNTINVRPRQ
jgi:caa(3)-type oxidase subunit IV